MGGHGTSYYSGIAPMMNLYSANNTAEGQNTVMYLQTAMYVIKSYLGWITKGKPLNDSVKYLSCFDEIRQMKFEGIN